MLHPLSDGEAGERNWNQIFLLALNFSDSQHFHSWPLLGHVSHGWLLTAIEDSVRSTWVTNRSPRDSPSPSFMLKRICNKQSKKNVNWILLRQRGARIKTSVPRQHHQITSQKKVQTNQGGITTFLCNPSMLIILVLFNLNNSHGLAEWSTNW